MKTKKKYIVVRCIERNLMIVGQPTNTFEEAYTIMKDDYQSHCGSLDEDYESREGCDCELGEDSAWSNLGCDADADWEIFEIEN